MYAPEHWSGSCRTCRTGCYGPALFRAKTVKQRPLLPREVETQLPDCGVVHLVRIDHLSRVPVMSHCLYRLLMSTGCKSSHNGFLDVTRSNGGLRISGWIGQLSCFTSFSVYLFTVPVNLF